MSQHRKYEVLHAFVVEGKMYTRQNASELDEVSAEALEPFVAAGQLRVTEVPEGSPSHEEE